MREQIVAHDETDRMFDTSPAAMRDRFGEKALRMIREGKHAAGFARLAASYAFLADPSLREPADRRTYADTIFSIGQSLVRAQHASDERVH